MGAKICRLNPGNALCVQWRVEAAPGLLVWESDGDESRERAHEWSNNIAAEEWLEADRLSRRLPKFDGFAVVSGEPEMPTRSPVEEYVKSIERGVSPAEIARAPIADRVRAAKVNRRVSRSRVQRKTVRVSPEESYAALERRHLA